jgi:hypothetical protein
LRKFGKAQFCGSWAWGHPYKDDNLFRAKENQREITSRS